MSQTDKRCLWAILGILLLLMGTIEYLDEREARWAEQKAAAYAQAVDYAASAELVYMVYAQTLAGEVEARDLSAADLWSVDYIQEGEDPDEAEKIEAALVEQGYFRPDVPLDYELQDHLRTACEEYGVPWAVALGLIEIESNFREDAVNPVSGCYGLRQLNPKYFPSGLSSAENIRTGIAYLGEQLERHDGDMWAALTAYNAGYDTGSREYANKVLAAAERWREE